MTTMTHKKHLNYNKATYDKAIDVLANAFITIFAKGIPFYKVNNISLKTLAHCYATGYNLYSSGEYAKAKDIFLYIVSQNYMDKKSWMGAAASCQMLKQYPQALSIYQHIQMMTPSDPVPWFHSFSCYLELKKYAEALSSLEAVILRSSKREEFADLKQEAETMKKALLTSLNKK